MSKKIILDVDDRLWERFKKIVTKDKTLNQAIIDLIKEKIEREEK